MSARHCTRRQPGRTVYTCTSCGRRWLQSELIAAWGEHRDDDR